MARGTDSYHGKALPILGNATLESETVADVVFTLKGGSTQAGDYLVVENAAGTELFSIDSSGIPAMSNATYTLASSAVNAITIALSSSGAIAATAAENANAILVQASSKSAINCVLAYDSVGAITSAQVNTATSFLGTFGTTAPTYFLTMGGTGAPSEGPATTQKMLTVGLTANSKASIASWAGIKCLFGSKAYYVMALPDSNLT